MKARERLLPGFACRKKGRPSQREGRVCAGNPGGVSCAISIPRFSAKLKNVKLFLLAQQGQQKERTAAHSLPQLPSYSNICNIPQLMRKRKPFCKFLFPIPPFGLRGRSFGDATEGPLKKRGNPAKFLLTRDGFSIIMYGHAAERDSLCAPRPR